MNRFKRVPFETDIIKGLTVDFPGQFSLFEHPKTQLQLSSVMVLVASELVDEVISIKFQLVKLAKILTFQILFQLLKSEQYMLYELAWDHL